MPSKLSKRLLHFGSISIGVMAGPGIIFLLPFILPIKQFASLTSVLAMSQLIMSIGGFSLDVSCPRLGVRIKKAAIYSFVSIILSSIVVLPFFSAATEDDICLAIFVAWITSFTSILHSYSLFSGNSKLYGFLGFSKSITFFIFFSLLIHLRQKPEIAWLGGVLSSLFFVAFFIIKNINGLVTRTGRNSGWLEVVEFSTPMSIIIVIGAIPFVLDRVIAQNLLSTNGFARYVVAITWALPIIYIGNTIQQVIVGTPGEFSLTKLLRWGGVIFFASIVYMILAAFFIFNVLIPPYFSNAYEFMSLWVVISCWYMAYSTIAFPVAAVTQRFFSTTDLKYLSVVTVGFVVLWMIFAYGLKDVLLPLFNSEDKSMLIIMITAFLAVVGLAPKAFFVFKWLAR